MQFRGDPNERDLAVLEIDGMLNEEEPAQAIMLALEEWLQRGVRRFIVDCSKLNFVSSYGLGILIRVHHRVRKRGGELVIAGLHGTPLEALQMTHLDRVFHLAVDVEQARKTVMA